MGQVPLLSREEEVNISKRIESAESSALKIIYSVSLTADFQLDLCKKLISREERFDRVVLDKKIDSRESYFRSLAKQVVALEDAINKINNAWTSIENSKTILKKSEQPPDSTITRLRSLQSLRNAVLSLKFLKISSSK